MTELYPPGREPIILPPLMSESTTHPPQDPDRSALKEGARLYNQGEYFDAHEVLEDPWRELTGADREIYQGIIQVAMGYRHATREKWKSAGVLIRKGLGRLERHRETWDFLPLTDFVAEVNATLPWLDARHRGEDPDGALDIPRLPTPAI
jgi:hypothetical protein